MKPNRHSGDSEWPLVYGSPQLLSDAFARKRVGVEPVVLSFAKGRPQRERKQPNTLMAQWEEVMECPQLKKSCNASRAKSENGGAGFRAIWPPAVGWRKAAERAVDTATLVSILP